MSQLVLTAVTAAVLCGLLAIVARRRGWLDLPSERKTHDTPTPLVGGVAVFLAFWGLSLLRGEFDWPLLAGCLLALACGLIDDLRTLSARVRFSWQALACLVMIFAGGVYLTDFGRLMWDGPLSLGVLWIPITVFSALGVINAFNMIDGVDGLSGTVFLVCASTTGLLAHLAGRGDVVALLAMASAAVSGFLLLNARFPWNTRARVFLGDAGSTWLGFFLAWMFIDLGNGEDRAFAPMTAVWIIGLPLLDTTRLIGRRWRMGMSALAADRFHLHHAFLRAGFSVRQTWLAVSVVSAVFAGIGVAFELSGLPEHLGFYIYVLLGVVYLSVMSRAWKAGRFLGRNLD
jgi:UDP-GlcNAc:undecaprenyl-phosphate GlcNAc-1-phosphate transferase